MITNSEKETQQLASLLTKEIKKKPLSTQGALIIALQGELGSGKTKFVQGFAQELGISQRLTSPTFVVMKQYKINTNQFKHLYHIDCYRLDKPQELKELDFEQVVNNSHSLVLVEWAEKVKTILPPDAVWIKFNVLGEKKREITVSYPT